MLDWFEKDAAVRQKFTVLTWIFGGLSSLNLLTALLVLQGMAGPVAMSVVAAVTTVLAVVTILTAKERICRPYVNTVLRMEALAAGDTNTPIQYTQHKDCVGRMTKAMATFRDNAELVRTSGESQRVVVGELSGALDRLAGNDLTARINTKLPAEYEALRVAFNEAMVVLDEAISSVGNSASTVLGGSSEIRAASDDLSNRNERQAANIEEAAAAMNRVTAMIRATADSARQVQGTVDDTHREADHGGAVVKRAVEAMAEIEKSSGEIAQISDLIDGIAFQTNLLALNAGVEAARAGDAGKGFAVVANEVRALAQRSADAARDIKELISSSTTQVSNGVSLVGETGALLEKIVGRVAEISTLMRDIAQGAQEQADNVQQVNISVGDMDRMTQQNAAMVEESTAAARSLADEANELRNNVARFRTSKANAPLAFSAPSRARPKAVPATVGNLALKQPMPADDDWSEF